MADLIIVLNAGSSSLKFTIYAAHGEKPRGPLRRPDRGHPHGDPLQGKRRRREGRRGEKMASGLPARPRRGHRCPLCLGQWSSQQLGPHCGRGAPCRSRRPRVHETHRRQRSHPGRPGKIRPPGAASSAPQPGPHPRHRKEKPRHAPGGLFRHLLSHEHPRRGPGLCPAAEVHRAGGPALRLSRPVLRVHLLGPARGSTRRRQKAGRSLPTSETAPACAP